MMYKHKPIREIILRLADGALIPITRDEWKAFLVLLENNRLTNESSSTHNPRRERTSTHGMGIQTQ